MVEFLRIFIISWFHLGVVCLFMILYRLLEKWIYYYWDLTPDFHVIFNKVNSVADKNNDLPQPLPLSHFLPSNCINGPTNKSKGKSQPKLTKIFSPVIISTYIPHPLLEKVHSIRVNWHFFAWFINYIVKGLFNICIEI